MVGEDGHCKNCMWKIISIKQIGIIWPNCSFCVLFYSMVIRGYAMGIVSIEFDHHHVYRWVQLGPTWWVGFLWTWSFSSSDSPRARYVHLYLEVGIWAFLNRAQQPEMALTWTVILGPGAGSGLILRFDSWARLAWAYVCEGLSVGPAWDVTSCNGEMGSSWDRSWAKAYPSPAYLVFEPKIRPHFHSTERSKLSLLVHARLILSILPELRPIPGRWPKSTAQ